MKKIIQAGLLSSFFFNTAFALNPVYGFYAGLLGEISSGPMSRTISFYRDNIDPPGGRVNLSGRVNNSRLGGGGGGMFGYRFNNHFRIEGEGLVNWIGAGTLNVDRCVLESPNIITPTGDCRGIDRFLVDEVGFRGSTTATYAMFNAYYDFLYPDGTDIDYFPYIGVGIGGAHFKSGVNFVNTVIPRPLPYSEGFTVTADSPAAQGILGLGYYLDDLVWSSLDFRYLSTLRPLRNINNRQYNLFTLNFTLNFTFDKAVC